MTIVWTWYHRYRHRFITNPDFGRLLVGGVYWREKNKWKM